MTQTFKIVSRKNGASADRGQLSNYKTCDYDVVIAATGERVGMAVQGKVPNPYMDGETIPGWVAVFTDREAVRAQSLNALRAAIATI